MGSLFNFRRSKDETLDVDLKGKSGGEYVREGEKFRGQVLAGALPDSQCCREFGGFCQQGKNPAQSRALVLQLCICR